MCLIRKTQRPVVPNEKDMLEILRNRSKAIVRSAAKKPLTPRTKELIDRALLVEKPPKETAEEEWPTGIGA
jgi:hypothetical protein